MIHHLCLDHDELTRLNISTKIDIESFRFCTISSLKLMKTNIQLKRWDGIFGKVKVLCNELFTGMSSPLELPTM